MDHNDILCSDVTHKVNWQGTPTLVVGTIDKAKQFHPFMLWRNL
jgi:hypothetical protein